LIPGVAFRYSPPEIDRGPVYESHLNHVLVPECRTISRTSDFGGLQCRLDNPAKRP
jgi:hypothetical protein